MLKLILLSVFIGKQLVAFEATEQPKLQAAEKQPGIIEKIHAERINLENYQSYNELKLTHDDVEGRLLFFVESVFYTFSPHFGFNNLFSTIGLNYFLKESIGNSYDAKIKSYYLNNNRDNKIFEIKIAILIFSNKVVVEIEDNSGGFDKIPGFEKILYSDTYLASPDLVSEKSQEDGYFGSMGWGLCWSYENIKRNNFELRIQNTKTGGSILEVSGPISFERKCQHGNPLSAQPKIMKEAGTAQ